MYLCSDGHDEICCEGHPCPACELLAQVSRLQARIEDLKDELDQDLADRPE